MAQFAQGPRRAFVRRRINELSSLTARIPSEILVEIFQIACQPVENDYRAEKEVTPFFIGSICSQWRDVAWSTPFLWNTILLHVSRKYHGQVQLLGDRLLNARSAPLNIKLISEDEHEHIICAFEAIMRILVTRSDYWLTFDADLLPPCLDMLQNIDFPMLTSVSLQRTTLTPHYIPGKFFTASKLLNVNLSRYFPLVLPLEQVRRFRTQFLTVAECLKILQQSPNLQECHFEQLYALFDSIPKTIMHHAQLKHLHVMSNNPERIMSLFDSITLPSLSNLHIRSSSSFEKLLLPSMTSLVLRSACNLERFTFGPPLFDCADLIPCLEAIPSLTHLHLKTLATPGVGLTWDFVASLDPLSNPSRLLLPNLKYFEYNGPVLCDCRTIVDMMTHRWHLSDDDGTSRSIFTGVSKLMLAEVLFTLPYHVTADVQEELRNLSEEGMLVRIESLDKN